MAVVNKTCWQGLQIDGKTSSEGKIWFNLSNKSGGRFNSLKYSRRSWKGFK